MLSVNLKRQGLPCRKDCGFVAHTASDTDRKDLLVAIAVRDDHELGAHGYIHQASTVPTWSAFTKPIRKAKGAR